MGVYKMNEQTAEMIINFLKQLGIQITAKVEQLVEISYPVVLKQVYVDLIGDVALIIALLLISLVLFLVARFYRKQINIIDENGDNEYYTYSEKQNMYNEVKISCYIGSFIFFVVSLFPTSTVLKVLVNPQWYTAKKIFDIIQSS